MSIRIVESVIINLRPSPSCGAIRVARIMGDEIIKKKETPAGLVDVADVLFADDRPFDIGTLLVSSSACGLH
jgi:hypothetical protein